MTVRPVVKVVYKERGEKREGICDAFTTVVTQSVEPKEISEPIECGYAGCGSKRVQMHQEVRKALRDMMHKQVEVRRYRCLECGRTFRVYPKGVSKAQVSDRISACVKST